MNSPRYRNLGISAHIDAGRTTLTERILAITSQIRTKIEAEQKPEPIWPTVGDRIAAQHIEKLLKKFMPLSNTSEKQIEEHTSPVPGGKYSSERVVEILGSDTRRESWVDGPMGPKVLFSRETARSINWGNYYGF